MSYSYTTTRISTPSAVAVKRIKKEIAGLERESAETLGGIVLKPTDENITRWTCSMPGPEGSVYEGGVFDIAVELPSDYPFSAPRLQFITKIYHCNVSESGAICLDILKNTWSPALSLLKVILSLSSLLTDPNPSDPLVPHIAQLLLNNKTVHDSTAREWVKLYALPKPKPASPTSSSAKPKLSSSTGPTATSLTGSSTGTATAPRRSGLSPRPPPPMDSSSSTSSTSSAAPKRKRTSVAGSGEGSKEGDAIELSDSEGEGAEKGTAKKQKELKGDRSVIELDD